MTSSMSVSYSMELGLRIIGAWPNSHYVILRRILFVIMFGTSQYFQYWYLFVKSSESDLFDLLDTLSIACSYSMMLTKLLLIWFNQRFLYDLIFTMSDDWKYCTSDMHMYLMVKKAKISRRFSNYMLNMYFFFTVVYAFLTLAVQIKKRQLLYHMEFPFDSKSFPNYELIMLMQLLQIIMLASLDGLINAIITVLILHAIGQMDIMRNELLHIKSYKNEITLRFIKLAIGRHQKIIKFCSNIESFYSNIALIEIVYNILLACFFGFLMIVFFDAGQTIMAFTKLQGCIVINLSALVLCISGEYLKSESEKIGEVVYECPWYEFRPHISRTLLPLLLRSQRGLAITVGRFTELSLDCFVIIVKAWASYISVLHALY